MLEHRSAWRSFSPTLVSANSLAHAGVRIKAIENKSFLLLKGRRDNAPLSEAVILELSLQAPAPRTATSNEAQVLMWLGPNEWLLELPVEHAATTLERLNVRLGGTSAAVTDISESFAGLELEGEHAMDILMSGCSLDLRPEAFGLSSVVRTAVANTTMIVRRTGDSNWRLLFDRSEAAYFFGWLQVSATEW